MKNWNSEPLPDHIVAELNALETMSDDDIDYSDAPSITDWSGAVRANYAKAAPVPARRIALPAAVATIYKAVEQLEQSYKGRKFTPDGHLVGSIGEVIAAEAFGLELYPMGRARHDAKDKQGREVQIKLTAGKSISLSAEADRLLVLKIVSSDWAEVVYDGPGKPAWDGAGKPGKSGQSVITLAALRKIGLAFAG